MPEEKKNINSVTESPCYHQKRKERDSLTKQRCIHNIPYTSGNSTVRIMVDIDDVKTPTSIAITPVNYSRWPQYSLSVGLPAKLRSVSNLWRSPSWSFHQLLKRDKKLLGWSSSKLELFHNKIAPSRSSFIYEKKYSYHWYELLFQLSCC